MRSAGEFTVNISLSSKKLAPFAFWVAQHDLCLGNNHPYNFDFGVKVQEKHISL